MTVAGGEPHPDEVRRQAVERARATAEELRSRMTALAASVAETEEQVADTYEDSARLRPHAADRLMAAAQEARAFAARERKEAQHGADPDDEPDAETDPDTPSDPPSDTPAGERPAP